MRSRSAECAIALLVLAAASAAQGQRSTPQFGFPPPNANQFASPGAGLFSLPSGNSQDLGGLARTQPLHSTNSAGPQGSTFVQFGSGGSQSPAQQSFTSSFQSQFAQTQPQLLGRSNQAQPFQPFLTGSSQVQQQPQAQAQQASLRSQFAPQLPAAVPPPPPPPPAPSPASPQAQPQSQAQQEPSQPAEQESPQPQPQPQAIQLARPSLTLASLSAPKLATHRPIESPSTAAPAPSANPARRQPQQQPQSSANSNSNSSQRSAQAAQPSSSPSSSSTSTSTSSVRQSRQQSQAALAHNQAPLGHGSASSQASQQAAADTARRSEATQASLAAGTAGHSYHCPDSFGYFRHHKSCDKYWACDNGTATLKLCGNGLMFDDSDPKRENCAYPFSVDCGSDRTDLEPPISTPNCPRLYGLFSDSANCRVFYSCWNGEASKYECPPGLAYDSEQRVCVWADLVDRCDQSEVSDGFVCPDASEVDQPGHYTRHAHPTDCRKFYVCIDGVARPYGCSFGTVFNVDSLQCDEPESVSGCEKYYGDLDPKLAKKLARENASGQSTSNTERQSSPSS